MCPRTLRSVPAREAIASTQSAPSVIRVQARKTGGMPPSSATRMNRYGIPQRTVTAQKAAQARALMARISQVPRSMGDVPLPEPPLRRLPEQGLGQAQAYELISSELLLDGSARLNLATFVTTWMPSRAERLMRETVQKNMIDKDEYPQTAEIESRCVEILADLWNAPPSERATGCSTTGSSEAVMLGGLALK